ncbi:MAG: winged helix-turn-helix domain-containing protein [Candidatus Avilachnospira sp.]
MKELSLRLAGILKRTYGGAERPESEDRENILKLGSHTVDFDAGTVSSESGVETLTVKEIGILKKLAENRGKIVTFDNLCMAVWGDNYYTYENTVMVHMRRLREKVEDEPSKPKYIVTKRGIGYKLNNEPG